MANQHQELLANDHADVLRLARELVEAYEHASEYGAATDVLQWRFARRVIELEEQFDALRNMVYPPSESETWPVERQQAIYEALNPASGEAGVPAPSVIPSAAEQARDLPRPAVIYFEDMPVTLTEPGLYEVRSRDWPDPNPASEPEAS